MSKEDVSTPAEEVNTAPEAKEESAVESTEDTKEETIASAIEDKDEPKIPDSVPYDRFREKVNQNKELKSRIAELESSAQEGDMSKEDVESDLSDIATEYDIPTEALDKVAERLYSKAQQTIEERLAPLTAKEKADKQNQVISAMFDKALEARPEFKDVADQDVIKQLALNPANANKTMSQLLDQVYGKVVTSPERKTMETTAPGKSEVIDKVDYKRAQSDSEYFAKIKADPELKAQYNEQMTKELSRYM